MAKLKDIINTLPRTLRLRFDSIGGYVQTIVAENEESLPKSQHLRIEEIEAVKLVAFTYAVERLFREGAKAARTTVQELSKFNIRGFQVGQTVFEGENENVILGEKLADDLMKCFVGSKYGKLITSSSTLTELIRKAMIEVRNERNMD